MIRYVFALTLTALLLAGCGREPAADQAASAPAPAAEPAAPADPLDAVLAGAWRDPANVARDGWRHPKETLDFFAVAPEQTVLEITPGGGWYAEILIPLLRDRGHYIGAVIDPASASNERAQAFYAAQLDKLKAKLAATPEVYGTPELRTFDLAKPAFGEPGTVDAVLTFRNVHNWQMSKSAAAMFQGFFEVLKPGGVLGVVEHRAGAPVPEGDRSGYLGQDQVIAMAEAAGFVLEASSEINANPADTKDHEAGVWSLPPVMRLGEKDREKYQAIGESDRMTLRFRKPGIENRE